MDFSIIEKVFVSLINFLGVLLGYWVYTANSKDRLNQWFAIMTLAVIIWVDSSFFGFQAKSAYLSEVFYKINWIAVSLFLVSAFYFYVSNFLKKDYKVLKIIVLFSGIVISGLLMFTDLIIIGVQIKEFGSEITFGPANVFFNVFAFVIGLLVVSLLIKEYSRLQGKKRLKIQYFLIGTFIFTLCNIIFNIIIPSLTKTTTYQHFGDYSAIFLLGFTAIAIIKENLFGIRVILTELLVGVVSVLLFINFVMSDSLFEYIWKGALFFGFIIFGVLLVKSVQKEIKQKELLEEQKNKLEEQTKKLEEQNGILEIQKGQLESQAKKMEEQKEELDIAHIRLEGAYDKLKILDEAKSEFISIASHQLRTPLTAIKGYISMVMEGDYGKIPKKAQKPVTNIYSSSERLINLVNSLLSISRLEAGRITFEPEPVNLKEITQDVIKELNVHITEKNLYLKLEEKNELPVLSLDKAKMRDIVLNLIDNAIRYTVSGGITVILEKLADKIRITVSDTGEGMTQEEIGKLFESFSRAGAGKKMRPEGTGLGLYIAKKFVEMHQGKVWAESDGKGKGSRFIVEIPITEVSQSK